MKYEANEPRSKEEVESAIIRNDADELSYAVVSAALYSDDLTWSEGMCLRSAKQEHSNVRGDAILGFGQSLVSGNGLMSRESSRRSKLR